MHVRKGIAVRVYTYPVDPAAAAAGRLELVRVWTYRTCCHVANAGRAVFVRVASDGGYEPVPDFPPRAMATTPAFGLLLHGAIDGISTQAVTYRDAARPRGALARAAAEVIRQALHDAQPTHVSCQRRSGRG